MTGLVVGVDPAAPDSVAPRNGQHTREVPTELAFSAADIDGLASNGVVGL